MSDRIKWYEDEPNSSSAGRLAFLPAVYAGIAIALAGTILALVGSTEGAKVVAAGGAIVGVAFGFKGWQKSSEMRNGG